MSPQYGELRPTSGWDRFVSLGHPGNFNGFRVLTALLHGTLVVGVSQTAALNRGRHLYSAGRPSRWALAHILVIRLYTRRSVAAIDSPHRSRDAPPIAATIASCKQRFIDFSPHGQFDLWTFRPKEVGRNVYGRLCGAKHLWINCQWSDISSELWNVHRANCPWGQKCPDT